MKRIFRILLFFLFTAITSCSVERYVKDGEHYVKSVEVKSDNPDIVKKLLLKEYVKQQPNSMWFGITSFGRKPVIYDSLKSIITLRDMNQVIHNEGYLKSTVEEQQKTNGKKIYLTYNVKTGEQYRIRSINRIVDDEYLRPIICGSDTLESVLQSGVPFNLNRLAEERSRITRYLRSIGYYKFNKEYISFDADTVEGSLDVDLTMTLAQYRENSKAEPQPHTQYRIGNISYIINEHEVTDSINRNTSKSPLRLKLLTTNTLFQTGALYNELDEKNTYNFMNRLSAVAHSYIKVKERPDSSLLDIDIFLNTTKNKTLSLDLEGTNSAGDFGAAASVSLLHNNLFHGSESFMIKLRGAYEAISGLEGYEGNSYMELGGEMSLAFPRMIMPYVRKEFVTTHSATTEVALQYNLQNRPEFNRRVFTAAWRYRWNSKDKKQQHRFDLLEVNYVRMPWISKTFKEHYLDSIGRTNAILKYNYEDQLITKLGYTWTYNSLGNAQNTYGKNAWTVKANIETSGNLLSLISPLFDNTKNSIGQKMFLGIAYSQYAKADAEYTRSFMFNKNNSLALHAAFGIAYPYSNSMMLPFEKRYFAGGANSLRGWSVRSLGPGKYNGADKDINFLNQSGDMKLYLSAEMRNFLFWKLSGALFIDAGNIWTLREYEDQPDGLFRLNKLLETIAVSYGMGLRFNFDFFILRFDAGMKAINPAYEGRDHFPIIHHSFKDDFAFHFAVGLPF